MFDKLFARHKSHTKTLPQPDAQLALGALLVRVALADHTYRASEVGQIDRILSASFGLKPLDAAKLRATCEALERQAPGTPEFARILREEVPYDDRKALANAMWAVALSDGDRHSEEEDALVAIETALGLSETDMAEARRSALDGN
jgi:uncharacterized tellurite resistance protein B-like protein